MKPVSFVLSSYFCKGSHNAYFALDDLVQTLIGRSLMGYVFVLFNYFLLLSHTVSSLTVSYAWWCPGFLSNKISYHAIYRNIEAARYRFRIIRSLGSASIISAWYNHVYTQSLGFKTIRNLKVRLLTAYLMESFVPDIDDSVWKYFTTSIRSYIIATNCRVYNNVSQISLRLNAFKKNRDYGKCQCKVFSIKMLFANTLLICQNTYSKELHHSQLYTFLTPLSSLHSTGTYY